MRMRTLPLIAAALLTVGMAQPAHAQSWRNKLKKAKEKVEKAAGAVDVQKAAPAADAAKATDAADTASGDAQSAEAAAPTVNVNYDFVPGKRVIFQEDFSKDPVGDLPLRVTVLGGNWEIAQVGTRRLLRNVNSAWMMIPLPETLPEKFTVELDLQHTFGWDTEVRFIDPDSSDYDEAKFGSKPGIGDFSSSAPDDAASNKMYHARIMVDGAHAKVYMNGKRVANVPQAKLGRANAIWIYGPGEEDNPFYITNIRIAASDKSLFDALNADGRVATHGILFDTNSDEIQPASEATLKEIGDMLTQHPDLKLTIEGHTDNVGKAVANMTLSQKRADAVKQYLVDTFHVDASRLQTKGYGDTKPVASNDTDAGRQQNRRVELVKM